MRVFPARWAGWLAVLGFQLFGWSLFAAAPAGRAFLELEIAIEQGGATGLLFDFGDGIWGENAVMAQVAPGNQVQTVRLELPARPIRGLRFDPTSGNEETFIAAMRVVDAGGRVLATIDPRTLKPQHDIRELVAEGGGLRVRPSGNDPMLRFDIAPLQQAAHAVSGRATVGRGAVAALAAALAAMLVGSVWVAWRELGRGGAWLGGGAIFLVVFGARLTALSAWGKSMPFWDEWEGDAQYILMPFVGGFLDWGALVMPQWEHRILLTRVIGLSGVMLNGEWDVRVAMTLSAGFYAAAIALVGMVLVAFGRLLGTLAAVALAACAALPFDVNNLLWGGQTQMYALMLMAVGAVALASVGRVSGAVIAAAAAGGLVSLFTMGAGLVGPGLAVGICLVRAWWETEQRGRLLGLAGVFFAVALAGLFLHTSSRAHVPLYATSFAQFWKAFVGVLAWPLAPSVFWAVILWAPWVVNGIAVLRRREATALEWMGVGLGMWGMINAVAMGYARQYEGPPFDTRFFTPFSIGVLGSLGSSVALCVRAAQREGRARASAWAFGLAAGAAVVGLAAVGVRGIPLAREAGATRAELDHRIRLFLASGQMGPVLEKPPHHGGLGVIDKLESPLLRGILPAPWRRVIAAGEGASTAGIEAGPVTVAVRTLMKAGPAIGLAGLLGCGWLVARRGREERVVETWIRWAGWWRGLPRRDGPWRGRAVPREVRVDRACYVGAVALVVGWTWIYHAANPHGLVDEPGHVAAVHYFLEGKPGWPESMPMLPGYHFAVLSLWRLWPEASVLAVARWTTALIGLVGLAAFALAWRALREKVAESDARTGAGQATLLLALLPLVQPFTGMAYSDVPALGFALAAWWAQVTRRYAFAAVLLIGAVVVRQTNLAWVGFFVMWEMVRTDVPRRDVLRRIGWLIALLVLAAGTIAWAGRLTPGVQHGNKFTFNIASVHFTAALVLLLGLPVWLGELTAEWRRWSGKVRVIYGAIAAGLTAVFAATFANPHIWNRELFWEGCTFTLLRNWPLVWIDQHAWLRVISGLNVVLMVTAIALVVARQRWRWVLWLVLAVGAVPVVTNGLVEPRYLIPLAGFFLLFVEIDGVNWRRLAVWWALLSAVHAPFVAWALSLW